MTKEGAEKDAADDNRMIHGQCLCGAVRFALRPPLRPILVCHCRQCSRWTGYAVAATAVRSSNFVLLDGQEELKWFRSSQHAERGFCSNCGSSLFWKRMDSEAISVLAGTLECPTRLAIAAHIHAEDKSDFYTLSDELPQYRGSFTDHHY